MILNALNRLQFLIETLPAKLKSIAKEDFDSKPSSDKWSKKQIIGHLIDSATNNHHRFIRAQFEHSPQILYAQNQWNEAGFYDQMNKNQVIDFWEAYNTHLLTLMKIFPNDKLNNTCKGSDGNLLTIEFLFNDYVEHLEHHMRSVLDY